jgi:hypothetical protein
MRDAELLGARATKGPTSITTSEPSEDVSPGHLPFLIAAP